MLLVNQFLRMFSSIVYRWEAFFNFNCCVQSFDELVKDPGTKTTYDVAIFANNSWQKVRHDVL